MERDIREKIDRSIDRSINQSINQSLKLSIDQYENGLSIMIFGKQTIVLSSTYVIFVPWVVEKGALGITPVYTLNQPIVH